MGAPVTDLVMGIDTPVGRARAALARHLVDHVGAGVTEDLLAVYTVVLLAHGDRVTAPDVHDARMVVGLGHRTAPTITAYPDATAVEQQHAVRVAVAIGHAVAELEELEALEVGALVTHREQLARLRVGAVLTNDTTVALVVNNLEPAWSVSGYDRDLTTDQVAAAVLPATVLALGADAATTAREG